MSQASEMLRRLDGTSSYADLQQVFAQLTSEAEAGRENPDLAAKIDEVIERLIRERARDERELSDVQSQYDSFREQNRGVFGWVKRHLPFTETHRQELGHQGEVADQSAEILADNVVIARAQMLKERVLSVAHRRLGRRITDWKNQWEQHRTQPAAAARLLAELHAELGPSQSFVAELQKDITAFAGAKFKDQADTQRRDQDAAAAEGELASLNGEIQYEIAFKQASLKLLSAQVAAELDATDAQFRNDGQQLQRLDGSLVRLNESRTLFAKLVATVGQVATVARQLQLLPEQLQQARHEMARIEGERVGASQLIATKSQIVQERQARHADSQRAVDQAKQVLASLQASYDVHMAQRAANSSMPQPVEAEPMAPIAQQYQTARQSLDQSQSRLNEATASLDAARREVTQAEANVKAIDEKLAAERRKLSDLERSEPQLRTDLSNHGSRGERDFAAAASALAMYLQTDHGSLRLPPFRAEEVAAGTFGYLGPRGLELGLSHALFHSSGNTSRHIQASTTLDRVVQWQDTQQRQIEQQQVDMRARRDDTWKRRCLELLGNQLAEEACAGGLAGLALHK